MSRRILTVFSLVLLLVLGTSALGFSSEPPAKGTLGLIGSLQGDQFDVILPWWAGKSVVVAPIIRLVSVSDAYKDLGMGAVLRCYKRHEVVSPYFALRGMALVFSPSEGDTWADVLLGGAIGGDYFLEEHFSLGVEAQLNFTHSADSSTRFNNPGGNNVNTAGAVFAAVYF